MTKRTLIPPSGREPLRGLNERQIEHIRALKHSDQVFVVGPAGTGKAQPLDSMIKIPGGWTKMRNIKPGMLVTAADGTPTPVIGVYPQGTKQIYRITFDDGRTAECCDEHLWRVFRLDWQPEETRWRVIPLSEIRRLLATKSAARRLYVELPDPEVGPDIELPIDPYLLGALLGDGHLGKNCVRLSTADKEMLELVEQKLPKGLVLKHLSGYEYSICKTSGRATKAPDGLLETFRDLKLDGLGSSEKFIPPLYMAASAAQKRALLQGLLDTDGTVDKSSGSLSFTSVSKRLAGQVRDVVRSLGGLAWVSNRIPTYSYKGIKKEGRRAYTVHIRIRDAAALLQLPRKTARIPADYQYADNLRLRIRSVKQIGHKKAQCIAVAHPSHLYVTDDYVVTHNTYISTAYACDLFLAGKIENLIFSRPQVSAGGERNGFLPGKLDQKIAPWYVPVMDVLNERLGRENVKNLVVEEKVRFETFEFMRGRTYKDAFILLDEAQNTTISQIKLFLTRVGEGSRIVLAGDISQCDLTGHSGLEYVARMAEKYDLDIPLIRYTWEDVVRSGIAKVWTEVFERESAG